MITLTPLNWLNSARAMHMNVAYLNVLSVRLSRKLTDFAVVG